MMPVRSAEGKVIAHAGEANRKDVRNAVEAAHKAAPGYVCYVCYMNCLFCTKVATFMENKILDTNLISANFSNEKGNWLD